MSSFVVRLQDLGFCGFWPFSQEAHNPPIIRSGFCALRAGQVCPREVFSGCLALFWAQENEGKSRKNNIYKKNVENRKRIFFGWTDARSRPL